MSALDKLRSFSESHEPDSTPIRDGLTYGDARELLAQLAECWAKARKETLVEVRTVYRSMPVRNFEPWIHREIVAVGNP